MIEGRHRVTFEHYSICNGLPNLNLSSPFIYHCLLKNKNKKLTERRGHVLFT